MHKSGLPDKKRGFCRQRNQFEKKRYKGYPLHLFLLSFYALTHNKGVGVGVRVVL